MVQQIGLTTDQMLKAPHGAVFVWVNGDFLYPRNLARKLGREDLKIVSPRWLQTEWCGTRFSAIVVDHAARLTPWQYDGLSGALTRIRKQEKPASAAGE